MKELSGKKRKSPIFIEAQNRMEAWKAHFQNLLNADNTISNTDPITRVFDVFPEYAIFLKFFARAHTMVNVQMNGGCQACIQ